MSADGTQEAKTMVAGALFDFLGYITSRDGVIRCGSSESPTEALGAMMEWFKSRGLDPHNADVNGWTALLAAVSRPAEARGEPWGYACRVRYTDNVASEWWIRFRTEELPTSQQAQVIPLYTHPAPSGGEAAPRPETGAADV